MLLSGRSRQIEVGLADVEQEESRQQEHEAFRYVALIEANLLALLPAVNLVDGHTERALRGCSRTETGESARRNQAIMHSVRAFPHFFGNLMDDRVFE